MAEVEWEDTAGSTVEWADDNDVRSKYTREELFDRHYFDGGRKVGGYVHEGYRDFSWHEIMARNVLARPPESILEIGCGRGYLLKRFQDRDVASTGLEISKHAYLTRVCDGITRHDLCVTPWPVETKSGDRLCFSTSVMEHIPEEFLPAVMQEMQRTCYRGLHGIDFGGNDDLNDLTHCSLHDKSWWISKFAEHAPGWPVEIVNKEELRNSGGPPGARPMFPADVEKGDGKVKINAGCFLTMHHYGWLNLDVHDLASFAQNDGYKYQRCDVRKGIPLATGSVDLMIFNHMLEHLTYAEGLEFLRECRRLLKVDGAIRVVVPDAKLLIDRYREDIAAQNHFNFPQNDPKALAEFDEINEGCAQAPTPLGKLWALLHAGHSAAYDWQTLEHALQEAGFKAYNSGFRKCIDHLGSRQILVETVDMHPAISIFADAVPNLE